MTQLLHGILILAFGLLVINVVWGVFSRYVLGEQSKWTEELARFLLIWVALLGGAVAFGTKGHLGLNFFVLQFHQETRKILAVVAHLLVLFFATTVFIYGGSQVVLHALAMEQLTPALGWKMGYVYLSLPIAGFFIVLYTLENITTTILAPYETVSKIKYNETKVEKRKSSIRSKNH